MLFGTIRFIFWATIFIICFFFVKKSKIIHKRRWILILLVVTLILGTCSNFIPVENAFITFSSLESAFEYTNTGDIKLVVNGEETDFVVAAYDGTYTYTIIPKTEDGWKLGLASDAKEIRRVFDKVSIDIFRYKDSRDYYVVVLDTISGKSSEILDNCDSKFHCLEKRYSTPDQDSTNYTYYAYVRDFNEQYVLTVNGDTYSIAD